MQLSLHVDLALCDVASQIRDGVSDIWRQYQGIVAFRNKKVNQEAYQQVRRQIYHRCQNLSVKG